MLPLQNDKQLYAQVSRDAVSVATEALRSANSAGGLAAFDVVAKSLMLSVAAIYRRERGEDRLADLLAAAIAAGED